MRIGIVTTWFERGAAHVSRQYRDILQEEHEVFVFARGGERQARGDPAWDDGRITWTRGTGTHGGTGFALSRFRRWLHRCGIERVVFNEQQWWPPVLLCQDLGIPAAAFVDYYTEQTVPLFANYDLLLCHTRRHASVFKWHPGCRFLPWGTRTDLFRPREGSRAPDAPVTFFHSAGLSPRRKGTDLVIEAFRRLPPPARLVLHSQGPLTARLPEMEPVLAGLQAGGRVDLHEREVGAPGLYHLGDVYVYPSRLEGIGLTIAEALSSGLPVIVPDSPPMNEFIAPGAGTVVPVSRQQPRSDGYYWPQSVVDPQDLAAGMQSYASAPQRLVEGGEAARRHARRNLDWSTNAATLPAELAAMRPLTGDSRGHARAAALAFERSRLDLRLFYPGLSRALLRAADWLRPLASRYSGRRS